MAQSPFEGKERFSIDTRPETHTQLANLAKGFKITQGEAVEALITALNELPREYQPIIDAVFKAKRDAKTEKRGKNKELYKQFKALQKTGQVAS